MDLLEEKFLRRTLELATQGQGYVSPNPLVGAVVARGEVVLGEGFHRSYGADHAEVDAIKNAAERGHRDLSDAILYVSLEPCCHYGKTPPCTEAILAAGIQKVVVGSDDPSEQMSGRGIAELRERGVEVIVATEGIACDARLLNQPFRKQVQVGQPYVTYKYAFSLDGRVAVPIGGARWVSGSASRRLVHEWRSVADAVAIGVTTAQTDDPLLTARDVGAQRQPQRVVFARQANLPCESQLVQTVDEAPLLVVCTATADSERRERLRAAGAVVIPIEADSTAADEGASFVRGALSALGKRGITNVLLEGGPTLAGSFFAAGAVDKIEAFLAPRIIGGDSTLTPITGTGADLIADGISPLEVHYKQVGEDLLVSARLQEY